MNELANLDNYLTDPDYAKPQRTGKKVRRRNQVFEHPLHPFENGDILSDTNVEEDTPERKEAEKVEDVSSAFDEYEETSNTNEQQDSLFDDMNPPL